jgi:virginiamycin B lyase
MGLGVVWFTEIEASKIGRLNLTTGIIDEFPTPTRGSSPYGIIVDPEGNAWYAALTGHRIGKVDAKTGEITEYPTPTSDSGTRRIAIDSSGKLWFTEYNAAKIGSFNPDTNEFKEYETISQSSNPYAIWVDIYDNVWFSMTGAFKVGKFDQSTNTIHEYDLPTPRTTIRFIYSDKDGNIWFPNNNNNKIGLITQSPQQPIQCDDKGSGIPNNYSLSIDGKEYSVTYSGSINNITANIEKTALEIDTPTDCLVIELPGELIDSTRDGQDVPFTVLVDGQVSNATNEEIDSTGNRVLEISLPTTNSVKKVEIVGTSIAPEFGSIAMVAISMALIGVALLSKAFSKRFGM